MNIAVEGSNRLINEADPLTDGIKSRAGNVTISGTGSLSVSVSNCGLSSSGTLTIKSGDITTTTTADAPTGIAAVTVEITGGTVSATGKDKGIDTVNAMISGGEVSAESTDRDGIYASQNIVISDGTVKATGKEGGIKADTGSVSISVGTVTAEGTGDNSAEDSIFLSVIPRIEKPEKNRIAEILKSAKDFQSSVSMTLYA